MDIVYHPQPRAFRSPQGSNRPTASGGRIQTPTFGPLVTRKLAEFGSDPTDVEIENINSTPQKLLNAL